MEKLLDRITISPGVCHGKPCVRGTRIMVWIVVQYLANGDTFEEILAAYPDLTRADIQACLCYAAELTRERVLPIEVAACAWGSSSTRVCRHCSPRTSWQPDMKQRRFGRSLFAALRTRTSRWFAGTRASA